MVREQRLDAPTSTEDADGFGGLDKLGTNLAYAPPAAPQIVCFWRKTNPTQSRCPIMSRYNVIPSGYKCGKLE